MSNVITFATENWQDIVVAAGGLVLVARVIVKLTPTPKDNAILEKAIEWLKHLGLHIDSTKK